MTWMVGQRQTAARATAVVTAATVLSKLLGFGGRGTKLEQEIIFWSRRLWKAVIRREPSASKALFGRLLLGDDVGKAGELVI